MTEGRSVGLEALLKQFPLNRKERFYTGTVFPALVGADDFAHLGRFLECVGLDPLKVSGDPVDTRLLFFTEYGFKESLKGAIADHFDDPAGRDTPDIVLCLAPDGDDPGLLVGIEAKMFHRPSRAELEGQLAVQRELLTGMAANLCVPEPTLVALLPEQLKNHLGPLSDSIVTLTWETLADTYRDVGPHYWLAMLDAALDRYDELVSSSVRNDHHRMPGLEILEAAHDETFEFRFIGRQGGKGKRQFDEDFATDGRWRGRVYQLRTTELLGNRNWFEIEAFLDRAEEWNRQHGS
jgi:hypothetical protein